MALLNYITSGTYSIVDCVSYSKQGRWLRFCLKVFLDKDKQFELASRFYDFSCVSRYKEIEDTLSEPPENIREDAFYLVTKDPAPTGKWETRGGLLARFDPTWKDWGFGFNGPDEIFYNGKNNSYFKLNAETLERITVYPTNDVRIWDSWFTSDLVFSSQSNLYSQIYEYLRTQPSFENVTDA